MTKAVEVRLSLGTEHPSCIKMLKGRQACSNAMAFPPWFGKLFLPKANSEMMIEDENGEIHHVKYLAKICKLSAGWNKFKFGHNLLAGDVLVFRLVGPYTFLVYIVRANDLKKADDLIKRLHLETRTKQMTPETDMLSPTPKKTKLAKPVSKPDVPFQELEAFKDFHIMVKGLCIDSKLPDDVEALDNSLNSFSQLGMKVGFLSERIATRSRLMFESENRLDIERYMEAKTEHKHIEDDIKRFTDELKKLEESSRKIQEDLKHKAGKYELKFLEEVPYTI
ncbi:putative transcription factor B3-Domain family [Helianthus debilis subsp. tardiflorus]